MENLDLFGNWVTPSTKPKKESPSELFSDDQFVAVEPPKPKKESPNRLFPDNQFVAVLPTKEEVVEQCKSTISNNPVYFGKSFEYLGAWEPGKAYYNDNYRVSFVTLGSYLLACNRTHESSEDNKPVILFDEGVAVAVDGIFWALALSGDKSEITSNLSNEVEGLKENVTQHIETIQVNSDAITRLGQLLNNIQNDVDAVTHPWVGTEEEYEKLAFKDPNRLYYIVDDEQI